MAIKIAVILDKRSCSKSIKTPFFLNQIGWWFLQEVVYSIMWNLLIWVNLIGLISFGCYIFDPCTYQG